MSFVQSISVFRRWSLVLVLLASTPAFAVTEYDRFVRLRKPAPLHAFSLTRPAPVLPGTEPRRRCVALGTSRCLGVKTENSFGQRYQNRLREAERDHPRTLPRDRYQPRQNF